MPQLRLSEPLSSPTHPSSANSATTTQRVLQESSHGPNHLTSTHRHFFSTLAPPSLDHRSMPPKFVTPRCQMDSMDQNIQSPYSPNASHNTSPAPSQGSVVDLPPSIVTLLTNLDGNVASLHEDFQATVTAMNHSRSPTFTRVARHALYQPADTPSRVQERECVELMVSRIEEKFVICSYCFYRLQFVTKSKQNYLSEQMQIL